MNKSNQSSDNEMCLKDATRGIHEWDSWINAAEINKQLFHFSDVQSEVVAVFQLIHFLSDTTGDPSGVLGCFKS